MRTIAFAMAAALGLASPVMAQDMGRAPAMMRVMPTTLSVSADADVKATPDVATINVGVTTHAAMAEAAMAQNASRMNAVIAALGKSGIASKDIETSGLSLNPQFVYNQNEPPKPNGYDASNTVSAKVRNLKTVGKALDAVVAVGSNQINGVSFSIDDPDPALDDARKAAVKKARARAELYAQAAGMRVGRIISIVEGGAAPPPMPMPMYEVRAQAAKVATPVAPGELTLTAHVDVTFELQ